MTITEGIITGSYDVVDGSEKKSVEPRSTIPETLERHGIDPKQISELIRGQGPLGPRGAYSIGRRGTRTSNQRMSLWQTWYTALWIVIRLITS